MGMVEFLKSGLFTPHEIYYSVPDEDKNDLFNKRQYINKDDLFVFLWERGGKEFVKSSDDFRTDVDNKNIKALISTAKAYPSRSIAQDFLDCVAIDEERVKQLIEEKEKVKE